MPQCPLQMSLKAKPRQTFSKGLPLRVHGIKVSLRYPFGFLCVYQIKFSLIDSGSQAGDSLEQQFGSVTCQCSEDQFCYDGKCGVCNPKAQPGEAHTCKAEDECVSDDAEHMVCRPRSIADYPRDDSTQNEGSHTSNTEQHEETAGTSIYCSPFLCFLLLFCTITKTLIMQSHNDCGVRALIIGTGVFLAYPLLQA